MPQSTPSRRSFAGALRAGALRTAAVLSAAVAVGAGCTDLTEVPPSSFSPETFFQNDAQVQSALAGVYNGLRVSQGDYWQVAQTSSDETIVPTRVGGDWFDGGQYVELWTHTYGPTTGAGNQLLNGAYEGISTGIARANAVLQSLASVNTPAAQAGTAEARVLRAWFYFMLQDLFGGVPIITQPGLASVPRASRDSVARFIEAELVASRDLLPPTRDAGSYGRVTRYSVDAMLSYLYLNWPVYTGTVTAAGLTPGATQRYQDVITRTDSIMNSGQYALAADPASWRQLFAYNNQRTVSPNLRESIFVVRNFTELGLGLDFVHRVTYYDQFNGGGGWNGFSTVAETYAQFDAADTRRSIFLVGPQRTVDTGQPLLVDGAQLSIIPTVSSLTAAPRNEGARPYKFTIDPNRVERNNGNDFTIFRYAGVLLDRAEALWRLGREGEARALINQIRARVYNPPQPLTGPITAQVILRERLNELTFEGKRRTDQIRLGTYLAPKPFKPNADPGYTVLMPIPRNQLQSNPALTQNPGYPGAQ
jgi:hypothetical protein